MGKFSTSFPLSQIEKSERNPGRINRRHRAIEAPDILFAEEQYSKFAIDALIVESDAEEFDLEELLYEFAGSAATMDEKELRAMLDATAHADQVLSWLMRTSFLGIEVAPGEFKYVEGHNNARRQMKVANRFAARQGTAVRYRVHPAFRHYLEIRDDDLHDGTSGELVDAATADSAPGNEVN